MTRAALSRRALRELEAAARWIVRDNPAAARAFRAEVARAAEHLGTYPEAGTMRVDWIGEPFRFATLRGFPYLLLYDASLRPPVIMRILHGARDLPRALTEL